MYRILLPFVLITLGCGSDTGSPERPWELGEPNSTAGPNEGGTGDGSGTAAAREPGSPPTTEEGDGGVDPAEVDAIVSEYCERRADVYCSSLYECGARDVDIVDYLAAPTVEHCRAVIEWAGCGLGDAVGRGTVRVNVDAMRDCLRAADEDPCFEFATCAWKATEGVQQVGESCFGDLDCASELCLGTWDEERVECRLGEGTCGEPQPEGSACLGDEECDGTLRCIETVCTGSGVPYSFCETDDDCDDGLACEHVDRRNYCGTELQIGEPCSVSGAWCAKGTYCPEYAADGTLAEDPVCTAFIPAGEPCESHEQCGSDDFNDLTVCHEGVCVADFGTPGSSCTDSWECIQDLVCRDGECVVAGQVGAPCEDDFNCHDFLYCVDGVCAFARQAGESCSQSRECQLILSCIDGQCVPAHEREECSAK